MFVLYWLLLFLTVISTVTDTQPKTFILLLLYHLSPKMSKMMSQSMSPQRVCRVPSHKAKCTRMMISVDCTEKWQSRAQTHYTEPSAIRGRDPHLSPRLWNATTMLWKPLVHASQFRFLISSKIWEDPKARAYESGATQSGAQTWSQPVKGHSPPLQGAPVTGDAARDVGGSLWRRHLPVSLPRVQPWGHGTLHLSRDLRTMRPLAGIPLPLVVVSEGKLELIWNPFIHFVLHHWHAVGFWATPIEGREQREEN